MKKIIQKIKKCIIILRSEISLAKERLVLARQLNDIHAELIEENTIGNLSTVIEQLRIVIEEFQGILTREKVNLDNPKKPGTLLYRLLKDFNLKAEDLRLGFYDGRPGFYYAKENKFIYINVVKGKAYGFDKNWVTVYV